MVKAKLQYDITHDQHYSSQPQTNLTSVKLKTQKQILIALKAGKYERVNEIVAHAEKQYPALNKMDMLMLNGYSQSLTRASLSTYYSNKYLVKNNFNYVLDVAALSNVLNHFMATLGYEPMSGRNWASLLPQFFIVVGAVNFKYKLATSENNI